MISALLLLALGDLQFADAGLILKLNCGTNTVCTRSGSTGTLSVTITTSDGGQLFVPDGGVYGSVTSVSVTTANGVSGSVATATTTPAITVSLGAITPSSVAASGAISGSNLSNTNTGDQTKTCAAGTALTTLAAGAASTCSTFLVPDGGVYGSVTNVTGTGPVVSSGGPTPAISMPAAGAGQAGYLNSVAGNLVIDAGLVDTATTASAFTGSLTASNLAGTNTGDVAIGTANGLSLSGQAISLAAAVAAGANGALLGTDKTKLDATSGTNSGDQTKTCGVNNWLSTLATGTSSSCTQPAFTSITGVATQAQNGTGAGSSGALNQVPVSTAAPGSAAWKTLPSCSGAASALTYDNVGQAFSCNTLTPGTGTVTGVSVTTANGVSGSVAAPTTTPAITVSLGDITPTSVASVGDVTRNGLRTPVVHGSGTVQQAFEAGASTFVAGSKAVTFSTAFGAAPVCTCSDTGGSVLACATGTSTTSGVTFFGTVTDNFNYVCVGQL